MGTLELDTAFQIQSHTFLIRGLILKVFCLTIMLMPEEQVTAALLLVTAVTHLYYYHFFVLKITERSW